LHPILRSYKERRSCWRGASDDHRTLSDDIGSQYVISLYSTLGIDRFRAICFCPGHALSKLFRITAHHTVRWAVYVQAAKDLICPTNPSSQSVGPLPASHVMLAFAAVTRARACFNHLLSHDREGTVCHRCCSRPGLTSGTMVDNGW